MDPDNAIAPVLVHSSMSSNPPIVIVPGWRDSGPGHWQTLWTERFADVVRVRQDDWETPRREDWVECLARTVIDQKEPVVLVAHSLGAIAAVHLPPEAAARVRGALLVAPADPERRGVLADFSPVPFQKLPYRSVLVASSNDPFCPIRRAGAYARAWGSELVRVHNGGHLNVESGHGEWPLGLALLQSFLGDVPLWRRAASNSFSLKTPETA